ncbi:hypothetical protein LSTR_LSTR011027 [Laodelphax striatellus]|uniref:Uncharacterized protein n=1 Tax=Laodelphax striatellus TaxID=195883 RepID=A0A482XE09_LAOST|nr:hypothetical protein LSTR_LSTR011027 [Laodelphax striatellus]
MDHSYYEPIFKLLTQRSLSTGTAQALKVDDGVSCSCNGPNDAMVSGKAECD